MERCPNCRARIKPELDNCRRCDMSLVGLRALEAYVGGLDSHIAQVMLAGDMQYAHELLEQRLQLKQDALIEQLCGFTKQRAEIQQKGLGF